MPPRLDLSYCTVGHLTAILHSQPNRFFSSELQYTYLAVTVRVIWHQWMVLVILAESAIKHFGLSYVDARCFIVDARWCFNPLYKFCSRISQSEVSRLSPQPKDSDSVASAQSGLNALEFYFGWLRKIRFSRKNQTRSTP